MSEKIKAKFNEMIESGLIHAHIEGPKNNVLVCESMNDFCLATGELVQSGFDALSPGGFGGSDPASRQNVHNKVWRSGTLCASVIDKRLVIFTYEIPLKQTTYDYCMIHNKKG